MGNCKGAPAAGDHVNIPRSIDSPNRDDDGAIISEEGNEPPARRGPPLRVAGTKILAPDEIRSRIQEVANSMGEGMGPPAENLEWLNFVVLEIWPFVCQSVEHLMKTEVEKSLQEAVPGPFSDIRFSQFSLGPEPPKLGPINVASIGGAGKAGHPAVELGIGVDWDCKAKISLKTKGTSVGIKKLHIKGEVLIVLCPLMNTMPIIGGIQITMVAPPKLNWELTGIAQLVDMPAVATAIKGSVAKLLDQTLVLPNRLFIHWVYGREHEIDISAMQYPMPEALLRLGVVEARGLTGKDWHLLSKATSDPYAKIRIGDIDRVTPTRAKTLEPKWGDEGYADFLMYTAKQPLVVELFDDDMWNMPGSVDDSLGELLMPPEEGEEERKVRLCDLLSDGKDWWPIYHKHGGKYVPAGEIRIAYQAFALRPEAALFRKPAFPKHRGPVATADCLLTVQLRGVRGIPKQFSEGTTIDVIIKKKGEKGESIVVNKVTSVKSTYIEDTVVDGVTMDLDPVIQRLVEYLHFEGKSNDEIVRASQLSHEQVSEILERRPSFMTKFYQSIHIPLGDPAELEVQLQMKIVKEKKTAGVIQLKEPLSLKKELIDFEEPPVHRAHGSGRRAAPPPTPGRELHYEKIVKLEREEGMKGLVDGPFDLDMCMNLYALVPIDALTASDDQMTLSFGGVSPRPSSGIVH